MLQRRDEDQLETQQILDEAQRRQRVAHRNAMRAFSYATMETEKCTGMRLQT